MQEPLHRCIMVQHFEEYFLKHSSVVGHGVGDGYNASQYQTQTIQVHTRLSPEDIFLKIGTIGFFLQSFTCSCLVISPQWKQTLRPRIICCSVSWWSKVHTATWYHSRNLCCMSSSLSYMSYCSPLSTI